MKALGDLKKVDIKRFAESLAKAGQQGVQWEQPKLELIRLEKKDQNKAKNVVKHSTSSAIG